MGGGSTGNAEGASGDDHVREQAMRRTLATLICGVAALVALAPPADAGKPDPMPNREGMSFYRISTGIPCPGLGGVLFTSDTSKRVATADLYFPYGWPSPDYRYGSADVMLLKYQVTNEYTGEIVTSVERPGPRDRIRCSVHEYSSPLHVDVEIAVIGQPPPFPTADELAEWRCSIGMTDFCLES